MGKVSPGRYLKLIRPMLPFSRSISRPLFSMQSRLSHDFRVDPTATIVRFQFWEKIDLDNILILQNRSIRFVGSWVTKWLSARFYRSTRVSRCIRWYPDALDEIRRLVCLFDTILSVEKLFFLFLFFFSKLGLDLVRSGLRFLRTYVRPRIIFYRFFFFYHFHFRIDRFFF